jgi:hypothetical protein
VAVVVVMAHTNLEVLVLLVQEVLVAAEVGHHKEMATQVQLILVAAVAVVETTLAH